ncbi:MAG: hypothetical protein HYU64_12695 [Armatimonadetes bacterium]|nr:hypothetical protein [Armatimonadota bacterium]
MGEAESEIVEDSSDIADIVQTAQFRTEVRFEDKDGFIIMETTKNILFVDDKGSEAELQVEAAKEGLDTTCDYEPAEVGPPGASECLDGMIRSDKPAAARLLRGILSVFGVRALRLCRNFGTTVVLASRNRDAADLLGLEDEQGAFRRLRAFYLASQKLFFLGEEVLSATVGADFDTPVHIFAHAYDHALGGDGFASLKSPAVLNAYHACLSGKEGHYFPDGYAESSPVHYFASSVEAYFRGSLKSGPVGPRAFYFTKEDLYDYDRDMFSYLDCLFAET